MKEFWDKHKADIGLAVLIIYTLSLGVATADQIFNLGFFPTKLDRMVSVSIEKFSSKAKNDREKALKEVIEYGDFAVPQLIEALDRDEQTRKLALEALRKINDQNFDSPEKWKEWYKQHKGEF